jgi:N-acetylmuramic acid 6-phosphate etherase
MTLTGLTESQADTLLGQCEGEVKTAVVAHMRSVSPAEARRLLFQADGHLRTVLEGAQPT